MSDFLNKLGAITRSAVDTASTELNIVVHEQRIREAYQALGRLYYNHVSSGLAPEGQDFDEKVAAIEAELKKIRELRSQRGAN